MPSITCETSALLLVDFQSRLMPVIEGAGGSVTGWDGEPLILGAADGRVLALGDPGLLPDSVALLRG